MTIPDTPNRFQTVFSTNFYWKNSKISQPIEIERLGEIVTVTVTVKWNLRDRVEPDHPGWV